MYDDHSVVSVEKVAHTSVYFNLPKFLGVVFYTLFSMDSLFRNNETRTENGPILK